MSVNTAFIIGNLTRDPESRTLPSGQTVTNFDVAVGDRYTKANGEQVNNTQYFPITVWGKQAENCEKFLKKGSKVHVNGRMTIETYDDKDGNKRKAFKLVANSVQFLSAVESGDSAPATTTTATKGKAKSKAVAADEDELPF